jgi:hypothetical protein
LSPIVTEAFDGFAGTGTTPHGTVGAWPVVKQVDWITELMSGAVTVRVKTSPSCVGTSTYTVTAGPPRRNCPEGVTTTVPAAALAPPAKTVGSTAPTITAAINLYKPLRVIIRPLPYRCSHNHEREPDGIDANAR